jgi:hypothetical protein
MAFGANRRSRGMLAASIGEAGRIRSANKKFSQIFLYLRWASPIGGVRNAGPIELVQHNENQRIGEAWITIRSASPAQRHSPRPIPNDWRYFRRTLVFAGHYL